MRMSEIISKHYEELLGRCTKTDIAIYGGKTSEDLLGESVLTALNKFREEEIEEEAGYEYLKKTFLEACLFAYKKKNYPSERLIEYVPDFGGL